MNIEPKKNTYIVEWQEIVTYSEEVQATNEDEAQMLSGTDYDIVDSDIVESSVHIERVQD
jgi:hypothetical protein